jgi:UDP-N-acetylmuramoyl-tripeptide--D-alanyl-D-alanine ligase
MQTEQLYQVYLAHPKIQTDTRKISGGEIFFALKGPNFNGNHFVRQALEKGAALAVADEPTGTADNRILTVNDCLGTLQDLALHHRRQFKIPFIAITGSNGKTTTKELVHTVLSRKYRTYTTEGNLNNHIGIPLTILSVRPDAEMAVIEMGANHQKEIAGYCTYTLPTHGIITNCGKAHLEGFGGVEGVRKGKGELYDYLRASDGTAFVMWDYDYLQEMSRGISHVITYGTKDASINGKVVSSEPFLQVSIAGSSTLENLSTRLVGDYNLPNILVAVTVGKTFGVPETDIREAIESYTPSNSRSQLVRKGSNRIVLDAYNANPTSMKAAIENFARQHHGNKYVLIGGMMELGDESSREHADIVNLLSRYRWKKVVLVGGDFANISHPYLFFPNAGEARQWLAEQHIENGLFLIKGSRSIQMEKILDAIPSV